MGFAADSAGGALLAMPTADARGVAVALRAPRQAHNRAFVLPVVNPSQPEGRGLYPFFFQDRFRSYFVRPIYADWRPPRAVAVPVFASARFGRAPVRAIGKRSAPPAKARRGGRGRREEIDEIIDLEYEALDAWEDEQDEAWHPDDAAEALFRRKRKRKRPPKPRPGPTRPTSVAVPRPPMRRGPAPAPRPAPRQFVMKRQAGYHEQRLQFVPFEHPDTCRFLSTLKAKGIDGLLAFNTTRPARGGRDHVLQPDGRWARRPGPSWFQRRYGIGPLVFTPQPAAPRRGLRVGESVRGLQLGALLSRAAAGSRPAGQGRASRGSAALVPFHLRSDHRFQRAEPEAVLEVRAVLREQRVRQRPRDDAGAVVQRARRAARREAAAGPQPAVGVVGEAVRAARHCPSPYRRLSEGGGDEVHRQPRGVGRQAVSPRHDGVDSGSDADLHPRREYPRPASREDPAHRLAGAADVSEDAARPQPVLELRGAARESPGQASVPNQRAPGRRRRHGADGDGDAVLLHAAQSTARQGTGTRWRIGSSRSATA